ncbi:MAG: hypothetical protein NTW22_06385 [Proteobacteria bacterium]|nr:hypothetical protein [Pseudomonadota bacterium]
MPRSPISKQLGDEPMPSPFSSTFSLLPIINVPGADSFYIGNNDDSDDGTV